MIVRGATNVAAGSGAAGARGAGGVDPIPWRLGAGSKRHRRERNRRESAPPIVCGERGRVTVAGAQTFGCVLRDERTCEQSWRVTTTRCARLACFFSFRHRRPCRSRLRRRPRRRRPAALTAATVAPPPSPPPPPPTSLTPPLPSPLCRS